MLPLNKSRLCNPESFQLCKKYNLTKKILYLEPKILKFGVDKQCLQAFGPERFLVLIKAVPLHAWSGPEGSRKLRFSPDYMTTAQDGGKVVSLMHRPPLPPGNAPGTHFC
jgi:hypothetical protein